jgi:hypothetical protein
MRRITLLLTLFTACAGSQANQPPPSPAPAAAPAPPADTRTELVKLFDDAAENVCRCADTACMQEAMRPMTEASDRYRDYQPTPEESEVIVKDGHKITECAQRIASAPPPAPAQPAPPSSSDAWKTGIAECDTFLQNYLVCIDTKMPADVREGTKSSLVQTVDAWREATTTPEGRQALANACKQITISTREATAAMGCVF